MQNGREHGNYSCPAVRRERYRDPLLHSLRIKSEVSIMRLGRRSRLDSLCSGAGLVSRYSKTWADASHLPLILGNPQP